MSTFSYQTFRQAFQGILQFESREVDGAHLRSLGGAEGVGLDLLRCTHNGDRLESAALQLAYAEGDADFDPLSRKCIAIFLQLVLGDAAAAEEWMLLSLSHLKADGVSSCATAHAGFSLRLMQMKPYSQFLLIVSEDSSGEG